MEENMRRLGGLILFAGGIALIVMAIKAMQRTAESNTYHALRNYFTHNPQWNGIITFFGGTPESNVAAYDTMILFYLIGGIILAIIGGVLLIAPRRHHGK